jgi:hypothetical protein
MDLDLGSKAVMNVKVNGEEYPIEAPTVSQTEKYQKAIKKKGDSDQMEAFSIFMVDLGMPEEVMKKLDVVQVRKLSEGLIGLVEKK